MLNWKNEKDYAYTASLTPGGWAFEFLRRNVKYKEDYQRLREAHDKLEQKYGPLNQTTKKQWYSDLLFWHYDPCRLPDETHDEWLHRALSIGMDPLREELKPYLMSKWGLVDNSPDPTQPANPAPLFSPTGSFPFFPDHDQIGQYFEGDYPLIGPDGEEDWSSGAGPHRQKYGYAVVVFNLELLLQPQTDVVEKRLKQIQKDQEDAGYINPLKRYKPADVVKLFVRYLRVLDGDAVGAKPAEMGPVLFGWKGETGGTGDQATKSAWESLQAAKKYVDRRYLVIPQLKLHSG